MDRKEIVIDFKLETDLLNVLSEQLLATKNVREGETTIEFNNDLGKGKLLVFASNHGVTLVNIEVVFLHDVKFEFLNNSSTVDFLFLNNGTVKLQSDVFSNTTLKSYQNIIIYQRPKSKNSLLFSKGQLVELNVIQVIPDIYSSKKNNNINFLKEPMKAIFEQQYAEIYSHFGNFNLRIADQIKQLKNCPHDGMIRNLIIDGNISIIVGLQLLEQENYAKNDSIPESLTQHDIEKIQKACDYIQEHRHEKISVSRLSKSVMLNAPKLQLGFKLLHNKTVNEYQKEAKLQLACEYLSKKQLSVSEIVYKIGYNSRSYFSRIFFERFGILPTEYRNNQHSKKL